MIKIGLIGGSGLDNPNILNSIEEIDIDTPYGKPTAIIKKGEINGVTVLILARHGINHQYSPTQVNYRANIWALKELGCTHILATTAVGSLREKIGRGDFVVLDQFIDFTKHRKITFYDSFEKEMAHPPMATPFDNSLRTLLIESCSELDFRCHKTGTVVTIEGPRFSTKAESHMFRLWGADVINMSIAPECILANELKLPYSAVAMSTDYDCWKEDEEAVTWESVLKIFKDNASRVTDLLLKTISKTNKLDQKGELHD